MKKEPNVLGIKNNMSLSEMLEVEFEKRKDESNMIEIFRNYFEPKLNKELQYFYTSKKLRKSVQHIRELLLEDAVINFFTLESKDAKSFNQLYFSIKNEVYFNVEIFKKISPILFGNWVGNYLKPIQIILLLSLDENSRNEELRKLDSKKSFRKKRGRPSKYHGIFRSVPFVKEFLQDKYGNKKRKSGDTAAIKYLCRKHKIPFKHSIVTSYSNRKSNYILE